MLLAGENLPVAGIARGSAGTSGPQGSRHHLAWLKDPGSLLRCKDLGSTNEPVVHKAVAIT